MKSSKLKGSLSLLLAVAMIACLAFSSLVGFGSKKVLSASNIKQGLDLAGGVSITYQTVKDNPTKAEMADLQHRMQLRAEIYSTESAVYIEGNNRITIEIPGAENAEEVLTSLGKPGALYFIYGKDNIKYNSETKEYELTKTLEELREKKQIVCEGSDISDAQGEIQQMSSTGPRENVVRLVFNEEGTKKFAEATAKSIGQQIAIIYDNKIVSAPTVNNAITNGEAVVTGQKTLEEANELASIIRIGALPIELEEINSKVVGAQLGSEALSTSLWAGLIGFILLIIFMIVYYRISGLAASLALTIYVGLDVLMLSLFEVTLTLQGIAGIILSIGMAVDANVIIFQRIREELAKGLTVRSAFKNGFDKALSAIIDGNVTTLIAAAVLYFVGSGSVKGFATTLAIGIILSMLTALFVTRFILNALYMVGFDDVKFYGVQKERKVFDFIKHGPKFAIISAVLIAAGIIGMIVNGAIGNRALNFGLDFSGGTTITVTIPDSYSDTQNSELEALVSKSINKTCEIAKIAGENSYIIRTMELNQEQRNAITKALAEKYGVDEKVITTENISARVSGEMRRDAILAVVVATICMLIYIWIRFKNFNFAASAVLALVHDVLVVLTVYAVARISVGNNFIACMLTIVGYSINATIVIFDRIRENMAEKLKKESVMEVVNKSITQTLSRSINTSLTTFFMVLALVIFGVDSIREFAIPLMAGIIIGAFSSVCITGFLWYLLQTKFLKTNGDKED